MTAAPGSSDVTAWAQVRSVQVGGQAAPEPVVLPAGQFLTGTLTPAVSGIPSGGVLPSLPGLGLLPKILQPSATTATVPPPARPASTDLVDDARGLPVAGSEAPRLRLAPLAAARPACSPRPLLGGQDAALRSARPAATPRAESRALPAFAAASAAAGELRAGRSGRARGAVPRRLWGPIAAIAFFWLLSTLMQMNIILFGKALGAAGLFYLLSSALALGPAAVFGAMGLLSAVVAAASVWRLRADLAAWLRGPGG